jgi:murein L,D-transpeptidase YafK
MPPVISLVMRPGKLVVPFFVACLLSLSLAASGHAEANVPRSEISRAAFQRLAPGLKGEMEKKNLVMGQPIFLRIFKEESELEVWVKSGVTYELFKTYDICTFSGGLGPKLREGDKQSPEGFYTVSASALNPWSDYHLSFNLGYPNEYDRLHNHTGGALMVHGKCESLGCFAMEDSPIEEIYTVVDAAMSNGQDRLSVHIFPFRMTWANLAKYANSPWIPFWENLKQGYDFFQGHHNPPMVSVAEKRYVFQDFRPFIFGGDLVPAQPQEEIKFIVAEVKPSKGKGAVASEIKGAKEKEVAASEIKEAKERDVAANEINGMKEKEVVVIEIKPSSQKKYIAASGKKSATDRKYASIGKKPSRNGSAL